MSQLNGTIEAILAGDLMAASRADANVTRQGVMNHQTAAHFMDMDFTRDAFEVSYPEAAAMSQVLGGQLPGQAAGLNTAVVTPKTT
jgi:hypothetical protein